MFIVDEEASLNKTSFGISSTPSSFESESISSRFKARSTKSKSISSFELKAILLIPLSLTNLIGVITLLEGSSSLVVITKRHDKSVGSVKENGCLLVPFLVDLIEW